MRTRFRPAPTFECAVGLHRLVAFLLLHCSRSSATCVSSYRHHGTRSLYYSPLSWVVFRHPMKNASNGSTETRRGGVVGSRGIDRRWSEQIRAAPQMYSHSCSHHRRSATSESGTSLTWTRIRSLRRRPFPRRKRRRVGGASVPTGCHVDLYRLIYMTTQHRGTDVSPVRSRSPSHL